MIRLESISTIAGAKALAAIGAVVLAFAAQAASAECELAAQGIEEPFAIAGDAGYLPFSLGSAQQEEEVVQAEVASYVPFEYGLPVEPILMAGSFEFD